MNEKIEDSFLQSITKSGGFEIVANVTEAAFDQELNQGFLRDIPFINSLIALSKIGIGINERLFIRKIYRFLTSLKSISEEVREAFIKNLKSKPEEKKRLHDCLLLILSRADDMEKPEYIARTFKALIRNQINLMTFMRLISVIDHCFLPDLLILKNEQNPKNLQPETCVGLENVGLFQRVGLASYDTGSYSVTGLGKLFIDHVLHDNF